MHVHAVLFDPCAYLIDSADGPVARDEDIDIVRHVLEQPQPDEVVLDRVIGAGEVVQHRDVLAAEAELAFGPGRLHGLAAGCHALPRLPQGHPSVPS